MGTTDRDASAVTEIIRLSVLAADRAAGLYEFFQVGQRKASVQCFQVADGRPARLVRSAILESLILAICRIVDGPKSDLDSLGRAFSLLERPDVAAAVTRGGSPERFASAKLRWGRLKRRDAFSKLRQFRNHRMAHTISKRWGNTPPQVRDLLSVSKEVFAIVEDLAAGCGSSTVSEKATRKVWRKQCLGYWGRLIRGQPGQ
jgi:hypothetical protein